MVRDKAKALERLRRVLDEIPKLKRLQRTDPAIKKWRIRAKAAIEGAFGPGSQGSADFANIGYPVASDERPHGHLDDPLEVQLGFKKTRELIELMVVRVEEHWPDDKPASAPTANVGPSNAPATSRGVFIVHGHDQGAKEAMARFVERVGLDPVILSEQANKGKTIIEKFEANSDVSYAIVLLTGDDLGGSQRDGRMRPRARQNVIFELGFFIGKLGRNRVCALTKGNPEIPSDYSGVVYIPMDEGDAWQSQLVKELKSAGFDVDANKLYD